jgi:hypothetical protein
MSNKRRHAQAFPLAATLIGSAIAICFAVFGIKALTVKYQLMQGGNKLKELEREMASLSTKIESLQTRKDWLTSPPQLAKALENQLVNLVAIDEKFVIPVGQEPKPLDEKPLAAKTGVKIAAREAVR